jgi:hypothetical protein
MDLNLSNVKLTDCKIEGGVLTAKLEAPATEEVKKAMSPSFEMWKPRLGHSYFYINVGGAVESAVNWGQPSDQLLIKSGNCFPTRELAETQAEIERITRKLNQAAVAYGGTIEWYAKGSRIGTWYDPYFFAGIDGDKEGTPARKFASLTNADRMRLRELNAKLTKGWSEVFAANSTAVRIEAQ